MNIVGENPGGRAKYFLNDVTTIQKLKAAADKANIKVIDNNGSKTIEFSTGAYVSVVLPLVKLWQEMKGHPIDPEEVDGLDIFVVKIEIERDLAGTILQYIIEMKVQGIKVKVTCYDTTLTMLVQSGKMLEQYCSRVLLPYLNSEIRVLGKVIVEKNAQVREYGEPRKTRNQQKDIRKGVAPLEPPSTPSFMKAASVLELPYTSRTPRLLCYSSPVPKILPLTLLPPGQEEVELLHPAVREVLDFSPTSRSRPQEDVQEDEELLMVEDDDTDEDAINDDKKTTTNKKEAEKEKSPQQDTRKKPISCSKTLPASFECLPDADMEARFGLLEAIVTSQSQIIPDASILEQMTSTDFQCAVCGQNLTTVASLQAHLLTDHCTQYDPILQMMQALNDKISQIATRQSCALGDIKEIKESRLKVVESVKLASLPPAPLPAPHACPQVPASSLSSPAVPSYAAAAGAEVSGQQQSGRSAALGQSTVQQSGQLTVQQSGQSGAQSVRRVSSTLPKISYVMDSIGHNVKIKELEKLTKSRISKRKAYGAVRDDKQKFPNSNFTDTVPIEMRENSRTSWCSRGTR